MVVSEKFHILSQSIFRTPSGQPQLISEYSNQQEDVKWVVAGLCRDLRGIASATTKKTSYQRLLLEGEK